MSDARLSSEELREVARFTAEELRGEFREMLRASAQAPAIAPPNKPPIDFDGLDAKSFDRLKQDLLRDVRDIIREKTDDFLPAEEIEERIERKFADASLVMERQRGTLLEDVRKIVDASLDKRTQEFYDVAESLGVPVRTIKERDETRDNLKGVIGLHRGSKTFKEEFWKQARTAFIGWILGGGSLLAGVFWWRSGGPGH